MVQAFTETEKGVRLSIRLTPKAASDSVLGIETNEGQFAYLKVKVRAVPEKGKANLALIRLLAKSLGLPKSSIEVISGHTSRRKTLLILGNPKDLAEKLENFASKGRK